MNVGDQRKEPRIRSKGDVTLLTRSGPPLTGIICDSSPSGVSVETGDRLPDGTLVRIEAHHFFAEGFVCYCQEHDGRFRMGIELLPPAA